MMALDTRRRVADIILGAFGEAKAPATYGRHVTTSVQWLRIPIRPHDRRNGKRSAADQARQTL
jgi:hypothetical protein